MLGRDPVHRGGELELRLETVTLTTMLLYSAPPRGATGLLFWMRRQAATNRRPPRASCPGLGLSRRAKLRLRCSVPFPLRGGARGSRPRCFRFAASASTAAASTLAAPCSSCWPSPWRLSLPRLAEDGLGLFFPFTGVLVIVFAAYLCRRHHELASGAGNESSGRLHRRGPSPYALGFGLSVHPRHQRPSALAPACGGPENGDRPFFFHSRERIKIIWFCAPFFSGVFAALRAAPLTRRLVRWREARAPRRSRRGCPSRRCLVALRLRPRAQPRVEPGRDT